MTKKTKLINGAVYRMFTFFTENNKPSGNYLDVLCDDAELGVGTIVKCVPEKNSSYLGGDWFVGGKANIELVGNRNIEMIAKSLADYDYKMPVVEKEIVVEKEVILEKPVLINKYEETLIDHLYNFYCKIKDRVFNDDFV